MDDVSHGGGDNDLSARMIIGVLLALAVLALLGLLVQWSVFGWA